MRQVVLHGPQDVSVAEGAAPALGDGDARVRIWLCGVCGSDVASFLHGHYVEPGQVMGHELTGTVTEIGAEVRHVAVGDRVAIRPLRSCGSCWYCATGLSHLCGATGGVSIGYGVAGGYADELVIPAEAVHRQLVGIADGVDPADGLWAEPLGVCLHALARAEVGPGARVQVTGAGPIGLGLVAAAHAGGLHVEVVEPRAARRELALTLGAAATYAPGDEPGDALVDAAFDASGVPAAIAASAARVRPGGAVVLLGLTDAAVPAMPPGVRLRGSFAVTPEEFKRAVELIEARAVRLGAAVTHRFGLGSAREALLTAAQDERAGKVALDPAAG
jgi:L-idonate 5-dehydrogenase